MILPGFLTHATGMPPAVPALVGAAAAPRGAGLAVPSHRLPHRARAYPRILHVTEREIEWLTCPFFGFLFIVVGAAVQTGLIGKFLAAEGLQHTIGASCALRPGPNVAPPPARRHHDLLMLASSARSSTTSQPVAVAIPIVARLIPTMSGNADSPLVGAR